MRWTSLAPLTLGFTASLLTSCGDKDDPVEEEDPSTWDTSYEEPTDEDNDGVTTADGDCDDADPDVFPGNDEECNGIDDNCNGLTDEGFGDSDSDGTADCLDSEECDGVDNDGDGEVDEGFDTDGDGIADCEAVEVCNGVDDDGDGDVDEGFDSDGDGFVDAEQCEDYDGATDCDDSDASINPDASEVAGDELDNDCDGLVDEDGSWAVGALIITEIMNNPGAVSDPDGEWFEVYNTTQGTLILNGLVLSSSVDGDWHQVEADEVLYLDPGEYFIFGGSDDYYLNGEIEVGYAWSDISLSNESDELIIQADEDSGVVDVDWVAWDDGSTFPDEAGRSMSLDPSYYGVDENDSGDNWCSASDQWSSTSDMGTPGDDNEYCWPVADASYDSINSTLYTCDTLYLDGSGSFDPDGASITYSWELTSAPAASSLTTSDLSDSTAMSPTIIPDEAGSYTFSLSVYNGTEWSQPSDVTVTITTRPTNTDPIAEAGEVDTYEEDATCSSISYGAYYSCDDCADYDFELDGSASYDPDGDWVDDPTWSITSGTASITDEDTWEPTVTVTGPSATYGSTTTSTVVVELSVTDCMGATGTDTVTLTYECTGA